MDSSFRFRVISTSYNDKSKHYIFMEVNYYDIKKIHENNQKFRDNGRICVVRIGLLWPQYSTNVNRRIYSVFADFNSHIR